MVLIKYLSYVKLFVPLPIRRCQYFKQYCLRSQCYELWQQSARLDCQQIFYNKRCQGLSPEFRFFIGPLFASFFSFQFFIYFIYWTILSSITSSHVRASWCGGAAILVERLSPGHIWNLCCRPWLGISYRYICSVANIAFQLLHVHIQSTALYNALDLF